jgi:hypothetical protein
MQERMVFFLISPLLFWNQTQKAKAGFSVRFPVVASPVVFMEFYHRPCPRIHAQLLVNGMQMCPHGGGADAKRFADFPVITSPGEQYEDLPLAWRKRFHLPGRPGFVLKSGWSLNY